MRQKEEFSLLNTFICVSTFRGFFSFYKLKGTSLLWSLTNSRGSRVAGPKSRVAGPMSRSRVQCRGRGFNVAVASPKSRSRVQCRGRGK